MTVIPKNVLKTLNKKSLVAVPLSSIDKLGTPSIKVKNLQMGKSRRLNSSNASPGRKPCKKPRNHLGRSFTNGSHFSKFDSVVNEATKKTGIIQKKISKISTKLANFDAA
mmetsp:Transcript_1585/g.9787  ORF Transcript_1585/g.9787 Transcript_1585/m.9787 type:complete len:110 (+) Transcript_1585:1522-1851(+)